VLEAQAPLTVDDESGWRGWYMACARSRHTFAKATCSQGGVLYKDMDTDA